MEKESRQNRTRRRFGLLSDVFGFVRSSRKWWLLPIFILLILVGALIIISTSSAISPFIYALI